MVDREHHPPGDRGRNDQRREGGVMVEQIVRSDADQQGDADDRSEPAAGGHSHPYGLMRCV